MQNCKVFYSLIFRFFKKFKLSNYFAQFCLQISSSLFEYWIFADKEIYITIPAHCNWN